jgi:hypothetical protein
MSLSITDVVELAGGRVSRATGYWGAPFPASELRAPFVDRRLDASD